MKHRPRAEEQDDLLRPRLIDMIDGWHELVKLAGLIDWEVFEREWVGFFPSHKGRPATERPLLAGAVSAACLAAVRRGGGRPPGREPVLPALHGGDLFPASPAD
jgi:hypothetical protein